MISGFKLTNLESYAPILPVGGYAIAVDSPVRTYLTYDFVTRGAWNPQVDGFPQLQKWQEYPLQFSAVRMVPFTPGSALSHAAIEFLLPQIALSSTFLTITDPPFNASPAPADCTSAVQAALNAAGLLANPSTIVDVIIPTGTWNYSAFFTVPAYVRLRSDAGGILNSTNSSSTSVTLSGDGAAAIFLKIQCNGTNRSSTNISQGITLGGTLVTPVNYCMAVGCEVVQPKGAHIFAQNSHYDTVAFNYAHDGYADTYHHTGRSSFCQRMGNRAFWPSISHGDDLYAYVSYQSDGDLTRYCTCIGNWGRNTPGRQLTCVGGGFIDFEWNDTAFSNAAGGYIAQESAFTTYGVLNCTMQNNLIDHANVNLSHAGILAYAATTPHSAPSVTFGLVNNMPTNTILLRNVITNTQPGIEGGAGIEIRSSCTLGQVVLNTINGWSGSTGLAVAPVNIIVAGNTVIP